MMPDLHPLERRLDLLVVIPTRSEYEVCARALYSTDDGATLCDPSQLSSLKPALHASILGRLCVGVLCLGGAGNLNAAMSCESIIGAFKPKGVVLIGIAAANGSAAEAQVTVGDVIYNSKIIYSSFAKASGDRYQLKTDEFGGTVAGDLLAQAEHFARKIRAARDASFIDQAKKSFEAFLADEHLIKNLAWDNNGFRWSPTEYPNRLSQEVSVVKVNIASGEMVLASRQMQMDICEAARQAMGPAFSVGAFEMEAYGVSRVCHKHGIPFLTLRGISDPGTEAKGVAGQKDRDHLAASCLSAAFARNLVMDSEFQEAFRRNVWPQTSREFSPPTLCLDHRINTACAHKPSTKCLSGSIRSIGSKLSPISNLYEGISEEDYSKVLADVLNEVLSESRNGSHYRVLTIFPYSSREVAGICKDVLKDDELDPNKWDAGVIAARIAERRSDFTSIFPHFGVLESCASLASMPASTAGFGTLDVSRVLIRSASDGKSWSSDCRVYASLLSTSGASHVKTNYVAEKDLSKLGWQKDDIILIEQLQPGAEDRWTRAFRYVERSNLLIVRGWHCLASGAGKQLDGSYLTPLLQQWRVSEAGAWKRYISGNVVDYATHA